MKGLVDILERLGMKDKNPILKYNQVLSFRVCCILPTSRFFKNKSPLMKCLVDILERLGMKDKNPS